MTGHKTFNTHQFLFFFPLKRHSIIDVFVVRSWSRRERRLAERRPNGAQTAARLHLSQPPSDKGNGYTLVLVEAITFECQKIILAALFSHIKGQERPRGAGEEMSRYFLP